jgi:hypothetical protein
LERRESTRGDGELEGRPIGLARRSDELCHSHGHGGICGGCRDGAPAGRTPNELMAPCEAQWEVDCSVGVREIQEHRSRGAHGDQAAWLSRPPPSPGKVESRPAPTPAQTLAWYWAPFQRWSRTRRGSLSQGPCPRHHSGGVLGAALQPSHHLLIFFAEPLAFDASSRPPPLPGTTPLPPHLA